jgi:hypothetical protein
MCPGLSERGSSRRRSGVTTLGWFECTQLVEDYATQHICTK